MRIRMRRDLDQRRAASGPMTVDAFLTRFPEVPRDLRDEPLLAEFVRLVPRKAPGVPRTGCA